MHLLIVTNSTGSTLGRQKYMKKLGAKGDSFTLGDIATRPMLQQSGKMYLSRYMTPTAQAARLGGDLLTVAGAWFHAPLAIAIGVATVLAAWTYGLIFRSR
jgi:hypothetical protein